MLKSASKSVTRSRSKIRKVLFGNPPIVLVILDAGDILIGDSHGNRFHVAVFGNDGNLLGEFECPHVKVCFSLCVLLCMSDCCDMIANIFKHVHLLAIMMRFS